MARILEVDDEISRLKYDLDRITLVKQKFPNFKLQYDSYKEEYLFSDKSVKYSFDDIEIMNHGSFIDYSLIAKLGVEDYIEPIIVRSIPTTNKLVYIQYDYEKRNPDNNGYVGSIVFCPPFACKDKKKKEQAQNIFRLAILDFIKANPSFSLNDENLDPRIKKLLIFT